MPFFVCNLYQHIFKVVIKDGLGAHAERIVTMP